MAEQIIFYIIATIIVFSTIMAVTTQKIIRSATFLLFVLLGTAGLYLLLDYHFLMAVQIAVYAGGVMVLFIFAILLTHEPGVDVKFEKPGRMFVAAITALAGLGICGHIIFYNVNKFYTYVTQSELQMQDIATLRDQSSAPAAGNSSQPSTRHQPSGVAASKSESLGR